MKTEVNDYKERVGFYALSPVRSDVGVSMNWSNLAEQISLGSLWQDIEEEPIVVDPGRTSKSWLMMNEDGSRASIEIFVVEDSQNARDEVVRMTAESMALVSAFEKFSGELGDFAVANLNTQYGKIVWARANVVVSFYFQPSTLEKENLQLVDRIDRLMDEHTVSDLSSKSPKITQIDISSTTVKVGDTIEFDVDAKAVDGEITVAIIDPEFRLSKKFNTSYEAVTEGRSTISIMIVDNQTLLFSQLIETITIGPN